MNKHQEGLDYIKETSGVIEFGENLKLIKDEKIKSRN